MKADIFVITDHVQFPKNGANWSNRVKTMIFGEPRWVTMPVKRIQGGVTKYYETYSDSSRPWRKRVLKTIQCSYGNAPYFHETFNLLEPLILNQSTNIVEYNLSNIKEIAGLLSLDTTKIVIGSSLKGLNGTKTEMLISTAKAVSADTYLCGGGASGYQEDQKFHESGINLIYQNFSHPTYFQFNSTEFIPGLSIIDVLMNLGVEGTKELLKSTV
jgi:hypothetical protein